jgi:hypothetical protein
MSLIYIIIDDMRKGRKESGSILHVKLIVFSLFREGESIYLFFGSLQ